MLSNNGVWQSIFFGTDAEVEARLSELGEKRAEIDELDSAHGRQRDRRSNEPKFMHTVVTSRPARRTQASLDGERPITANAS